MRWTWIWLVAVAIALVGCTAAQGPTTSGASFAAASGGTPVAVVNNPAPVGSDYQISPNDLVQVSVFQVPDLNTTVQVSANGMIALPLIGRVLAAGKTAGQLQADIAAKLGAKYLQNPEVFVSIKDAQGDRVTFSGAIGHQGVISLSGPTTLLQGIAMAGGLSSMADPRAVIIFRQIDGKREAAKFDFAAIQAGTAKDPALLGGDIVVVDQSGLKAALGGVTTAIRTYGLFTPFIP